MSGFYCNHTKRSLLLKINPVHYFGGFILACCLGCSSLLGHSLGLSSLTEAGKTTIMADEGLYDGKEIQLRGNVHVESTLGHVDADAATVQATRCNNQWNASHILLTGHVRMSNDIKTQFALADRVEIFPDQHVMEFTADSGSHVLFIDLIKHMQLAAQQVRAEQGEKETVQGFGDVRFVFGSEELERLKASFSLEPPQPHEES